MATYTAAQLPNFLAAQLAGALTLEDVDRAVDIQMVNSGGTPQGSPQTTTTSFSSSGAVMTATVSAGGTITSTGAWGNCNTIRFFWKDVAAYDSYLDIPVTEQDMEENATYTLNSFTVTLAL